MNATLGRLRERREQGEGGFTLIELLIVIVILAILAAIVVFAVQNLAGKSATAACKADYKTAETAVEAYKAEMGNYPSGSATAADPKPYTDSGAGTDNAAAADGELLVAGDKAPNIGTDATIGPWLRDVPTNAGHYTITVANDGTGKVTVENSAGTAVTDCTAI